MGFLAIIPTLLQFLGPMLEKAIPDAGARAEAQAKLQQSIIENAASLNQAMADVMKADAASESWAARNARPITVFWALAMITWVGVISPMAGLQSEVVSALGGVPENLWSLLSVGIGAYMLARTVEKAADKYVAAKS